MALMPCTQCGQRFTGEAQNIYVQHYRGDEVEAYRVLGCESCADELLDALRRTALYRAEHGEWEYPDGTGKPQWLPALRGTPSRRR